MALNTTSRRTFLKLSAAVAAPAALPWDRFAHAAGSDIIRVGMVGCGGRGTGAALNALNAGPDVRLVAMGDLFRDKLDNSRQQISELKKEQVVVDDEHCFTGFDSYQKVIASDVDVVLLALPTCFHPPYLKACIDANKHVFCEKIHAVDAPGVRTIEAATEGAKKKGLSVVSGLMWRYDTGVRETMKRVHEGAIGEIVAIEEICNTASLPCRPRQPQWNEMEYQLHDWYNFFWLAGDLPCLNLVHNLDKGAWALHDTPPDHVWAMGGRQTRIGPEYGNAWDHHAAVFEYADGKKLFAFCRQQNGPLTEISDRFIGTKGRCDLLRNTIEGENPWRYKGPKPNPYDLEHVALFSAIRNNEPINNGVYMARSSMMAIMMTWACYTGQEITWEAAMNSNYVVAPKTLALDAEPPTLPDAQGLYSTPIPGITKFQ